MSFDAQWSNGLAATNAGIGSGETKHLKLGEEIMPVVKDGTPGITAQTGPKWTRVTKTYSPMKSGDNAQVTIEVSNASIEKKGGLEQVLDMFRTNWKHTRDMCGLDVKGFFSFDAKKFIRGFYGV